MGDIQIDDRGLILTCPSCGQRNRIPYDRGGETRCGRCKAELSPPAEPIEAPDTNAFDALVRNSRLPVVVDFWAPWCGPCRMVAPELVKVARANAGRWIVAKVNTDVLSDLGERYGIRSIPTMAVFDGGREVGRTSGARPSDAIEQFVRDTLAAVRR